MYTVTVNPSGQQFTVEEGENVLEAGLRQGIALPYSCRGGSCGSCLTQIEKGIVDYPEGEPLALAPYDMERGKALLCQAVAMTDLVVNNPQVGVEPELEVKTLPARVEKMRKLNHDVMELTLKLPATERMRFRAGQYIEVILRDGKRRAFSLANAPYDDQYLELHIRHVPGGQFTTQVFGEMKEKALLRIEGPLGSFYLRDSDRPILLIGGGTGFAPLKSIVGQLKAKGIDKPVTFYWGVRSQADLYMDYLPRDWASRSPLFNYVPVLSEPKPEDHWQGRTGWVHQAVLEDISDLAAYDVYLSGPPPMIQAARLAFLERGLPGEQMYSDSFEYGLDTLRALSVEAKA